MGIPLPCWSAIRAPFKISAILLLLLWLQAFDVAAQTKTASWTGEGTRRWIWWPFISEQVNTTDWNNTDNWSPRAVPDANTDVTIGGAENQPVIAVNNAVTVRSLTINSSGNLTARNLLLKVTVTGDLLINSNGRFTNNGSDVVVNGNWTNNGTYAESILSANSTTYYPTVEFGGSSKSIGGSAANTFNFLVIRGDIALSNPIRITPLGSTLSKLEVLGTFDPNAHKVTFTATPPNGFTLGDGAVLKVKAATFEGNYSLNSNAYYPTSMFATSVIDYAADVNQTVLARTYGRLKISGGGVKALEGNTIIAPSSAQTQLLVQAGTLDLGGFTLNRTGTGSVAGGSLAVANGATLKIGGTGTFPAGFATRDLSINSTVEYNGSNQTVTNEAYGNLTLSGSGTKTLPVASMTIAGKLLGTGSANFTAGGNMSINGDVELGAGAVFTGAAFTHTVGGNWTDNATFAAGTSTVVLNRSGKSIIRTVAGIVNFHNLTLAGAGTSINAPLVSISGNLSTTEAGTVSQLSGGTITMTGSAKTIAGNGIAFQNLTIDGTVSTAATFEVQGNLAVNSLKSFTATAGTINMTGTGKSISNAGTLTLFGLRANGTIGTVSFFDIKSDLSGAGSLTASAGTVTFSGSSTFNGNHNLFNVTVSGSLLRMAANANLGIAGGFTANANFDATTNRPNTVTFNGTTPQTIPGLTYHSITFANSGNKTAGAAITANGNLSIGTGATFTAGTHTHTLHGNWANSGTFSAGTGTVALAGGANTTITGATTFNALTLQKASAGNTVTLNTSVTTKTLHMLNGLLITGAQQVNLTGDRTGDSWVVGTLRRTHAFEANKAYAFNGPYTQMRFATVSGVSDVSMNLRYGIVTDFPSGGAGNGTYTVAIPSGSYTGAMLQLQYQDSELNGNVEAELQLYKRINATWTPVGKAQNNVDQDWVNQSALADVTGIWTLSSTASTYRWRGGNSTAWELPANWDNITGSSPVQAVSVPGAMDMVEMGSILPTHQPVINSAAKVNLIQFKGTSPITLSLGTGSLAVEGNVAASGPGANVQHTIQTGSQNLTIGGYLMLNDGSAGNSIRLQMGAGTTTVAGDLMHAGNGSIALGSGSFRLSGNYNLTAPRETFDMGTGSFTYEGANAQVIGVVRYNNLTIDKPSGVATLLAPAEGLVAGDVTVNSGTFSIPGGTYTLEKNVIQRGGVLEVGSSTITVQGNWTKSGGTFEPNTSTITLQGSSLQTNSPLTFNNLLVAKAPEATLTVTGNVLVNNTLELQSGTLDLGTSTVNRSAAGGRFVMGDAATLLLSASNFPARYNTILLGALSTVKYQGNASQDVAAVTYGNLEVSNGGQAKSLVGNARVAGDLLIQNGAALNANAHVLTLNGNFTNNGTYTAGPYASPTPPSGSLILHQTGATEKVISGNALTLNNLVVKTGANYKLTTDLTVNGNVEINGNDQVYTNPLATDKVFDLANNGMLHTNTVLVHLAGDMTNEGILIGAGTRKFMGTRAQNIHLNAPLISDAVHGASTIVFDGSVPPVFNSKSDAMFADLIINNTGGIRTSMNWQVYGTLSVHEGATFNGGALTHTIHTAVNNQGTIISAGVIHFDATPTRQNTSSHPFHFGTRADAFQSTGTLRVSGAGKVVPTGIVPASFNNLVLLNTHPGGIDMTSMIGTDVRVKGNVTIGSSTTWYGSDKKYTLEGSVNNDGMVEAREADFTFTSTKVGADGQPEVAQVTGAGTVSVQNFIVGDNARVNLTQEIVNIYKDFVHNGTAFNGTKTELKFKGERPSAILSKGEQSINIQHVHIAKAEGAAVTLVAPLKGVSSLMVESGIFNTEAQTIATTGDRDEETTGQTSSFSIADGAFYKLKGRNTFPEFKTYRFKPNGTVVYEGTDQTVKSIQYGTLQLANTGLKTFEGDTARLSGAFTIAPEVGVVMPKVFEYNGASAQTVTAVQYNNLILSNRSHKTLAAGTTGIAQKFIVADTTTVTAAGAGVTVNYNGAGTQQVLPTNYHNLRLSNGGAKQFSGTTGIAGTFSLLDAATADLTRENTIVFNGNGPQPIPALAYYNLTSAGTGIKTLDGDASVAKQLLLSAGEIRTGSNAITLSAEGHISEIETAYVTGAVVTQRELTGAREDFGGMGLAITPGAGAPGPMTVIRNTGKAVGANNSILRNFRVIPFGANSNLNAVVEIAYFDHELNGVSEGMISFYTSNDGSNWKLRTEEQKRTTNLVTMSGEQTLQQLYTLGSIMSPLPVELLYFNAVRSGPDAVLSWATASEQDNKGFAIEVSTDGYKFRQLHFVESKNGNSALTQKYSYTDTENGKAGVRYYRLRQVDNNGDEKIYSPKFVSFGFVENVAVAAYPNPFSSHLTLSISTPAAGMAGIKIYDAVGKLLVTGEQQLQVGATLLPLKVDSLSQSGMYVLTIELNGTVHRLKVLKR